MLLLLLLRQCTKRPPKNGIHTHAGVHWGWWGRKNGKMAKRQKGKWQFFARFVFITRVFSHLLRAWLCSVLCVCCMWCTLYANYIFFALFASASSSQILICRIHTSIFSPLNGRHRQRRLPISHMACIQRSVSGTTATTTILRFVYCILLRLLLSFGLFRYKHTWMCRKKKRKKERRTAKKISPPTEIKKAHAKMRKFRVEKFHLWLWYASSPSRSFPIFLAFGFWVMTCAAACTRDIV